MEPLRYSTVTVPMTFPVENRPIIISAVADMTYQTTATELPHLVRGVQRVLEMHPDDNLLIHTNSYRLTGLLRDGLGKGTRYNGREVLAYFSSDWREKVLDKYKRQGGILLASSLDRGVDLPGALCRAQIIAKVPYPSLGDKRVSTRAHQGREGELWYKVQTVRRIVQATGRAVRSRDDRAVAYILDTQFMKKMWKGGTRLLFPEWWREAVEVRPAREFQ